MQNAIRSNVTDANVAVAAAAADWRLPLLILLLMLPPAACLYYIIGYLTDAPSFQLFGGVCVFDMFASSPVLHFVFIANRRFSLWATSFASTHR